MTNANSQNLQLESAYQLLENRPLGMANIWQSLIELARQKQYGECETLFYHMYRHAAPLSGHELVLITQWRSLLFEYIGLCCHLGGSFWEARQFYSRSKSAFKELRVLADVQRLGTLEWLLARKSRVSQDRSVLERYLDNSMNHISRLDTTDILIGYLTAESSDWGLRRMALEALAARREWNFILNLMDCLPLHTQRDALAVLSEMRISVSFEWLANCILNQDAEMDWSVRHLAARLLQFTDRCEMSNDDWRRATWDNNFMVRVEIVHAMEKWKPQFIADYLLEMLHDSSIDVQIAVLQLMAEIKDPRFVEAVKNMTSSDYDLIGRSSELHRKSFLEKMTH